MPNSWTVFGRRNILDILEQHYWFPLNIGFYGIPEMSESYTTKCKPSEAVGLLSRLLKVISVGDCGISIWRGCISAKWRSIVMRITNYDVPDLG